MSLSTAIVTPTRNNPELLGNLLAALARLAPPPGPLEVVIADTGDVRPVRLPDDFPLPARVVGEPSGWRTRGLNTALLATSADFIIVFDDDAVPDPGCVRHYVEAAQRYGPGWFFGGPHRPVDEAGQVITDWGPWHDILPRSVRGIDLGEAEVTVRDSRFLGFNMAAFRADLLRVGGFPTYLGPNPEHPVRGGETICLERLLAEQVWGVFLPGARVTHLVPASNRTLAFALRRARMTGKGRAMADAFEDGSNGPPSPGAELARAARAALRWLAAGPRLQPRRRRLRLLYELHHDIARVLGARRATRGAEACGHKRLNAP